MKQAWNYRKIKWTAFFVTVTVLGIGLTAIYLSRQQPPAEPTPEYSENDSGIKNAAGFYSNEAFGELIEENLSELGFFSGITFKGENEGQYTISGTLSNPERLIAINSQFKSFSSLINALKDETIKIKGHVGENENGNGCFVTDTITFTGYTLPAGAATSYIEEYTCLNDLLEVPIHQINVSAQGITFKEEVPTVIQTA